MNPRLRFPARTVLLLLSAAVVTLADGGCLAYHAVAVPVKVATSAVVVTGEVAGATVKATGKVAVSAINAAGQTGSGGIDAAARLTAAGMVTFVDSATGTIVRIPWRHGMTLAGAGADARVPLAKRTIQVVRGGAVVLAARRPVGSALLASGDVVTIGG